jgi:bifunctional UDP-N-acetylglucosamine pyrophosphorylase/glucosamine-1-phosphate N-acetyltransferase
MSISIVILAAGQGKRMQSQLPKVLHRLAGKTLLEHVIVTAQQFGTNQNPIVIYGHQGSIIREMLPSLRATWVEQTEQLGTGHAVLQALPSIDENDRVLILYGDVPLIATETLERLIKNTPQNSIGIITAELPNPDRLGRIIRDSSNNIMSIVEEKDATLAERAIKEINSGIYLIPAAYLKKWLPTLKNNNAQKEYYLTDIIKLATKEHIPIHSEKPTHIDEVFGINDRLQLAAAERFYQRIMAEKLMREGVTLYDPNRLDVRGDLIVGHDVIIDANVVIEGRVIIGSYCVIGPNTFLRNVVLGDNIEVKANCYIEDAEISEHCVIGPFARIRPGTSIAANAQIGNFIEIKNSRIGTGTKIHHVGYIGDSDIGQHVNIGAGTITCNYDGINKHKTIIGDHAFIGSNSELVAPVSIGEGAVIGAGSTIRHDAPAHQLTVSSPHQRTIDGWQKKAKKQKEK